MISGLLWMSYSGGLEGLINSFKTSPRITNTWVGAAFWRRSFKRHTMTRVNNNQTHGIGKRSRKGISLIPFPWITQGESEGLL